MRETRVEKAFVEKVEAAGGEAPKLTTPGRRGWPDRLVVMPGRAMWLAELKAPWGSLSRIQQKRIREIRAMGVRVEVLGSIEDVEALIL